LNGLKLSFIFNQNKMKLFSGYVQFLNYYHFLLLVPCVILILASGTAATTGAIAQKITPTLLTGDTIAAILITQFIQLQMQVSLQEPLWEPSYLSL
jgi:uncharacterized membrane protein